MTTIYKIRNKDGLFSRGTLRVKFNKNGKIWKTKAHVNQHLKLVKDYYDIASVYKDCEIVKYEIKEIESEKITQ